jgi:hypothetical protein
MARKNDDEPIEAEVINEKRSRHRAKNDDGRIFIGLLLIVIGGMFFIQSYFGVNVWSNLWPIILILIGLLLVLRRNR